MSWKICSAYCLTQEKKGFSNKYPALICDHWGLIYRIQDDQSVSGNTIVKKNPWMSHGTRECPTVMPRCVQEQPNKNSAISMKDEANMSTLENDNRTKWQQKKSTKGNRQKLRQTKRIVHIWRLQHPYIFQNVWKCSEIIRNAFIYCQRTKRWKNKEASESCAWKPKRSASLDICVVTMTPYVATNQKPVHPRSTLSL